MSSKRKRSAGDGAAWVKGPYTCEKGENGRLWMECPQKNGDKTWRREDEIVEDYEMLQELKVAIAKDEAQKAQQQQRDTETHNRLVEEIKQIQRTHSDYNEAWTDYCKESRENGRDPAKCSLQSLQTFLQQHAERLEKEEKQRKVREQIRKQQKARETEAKQEKLKKEQRDREWKEYEELQVTLENAVQTAKASPSAPHSPG